MGAVILSAGHRVCVCLCAGITRLGSGAELSTGAIRSSAVGPYCIEEGGISGFYSQYAAFSTVLQYLQPQSFLKTKPAPL